MIDLHVILLPNVEKGPTDTETFLKMSRKLVSEGITTIMTSPFYDGKDFGFERNTILDRVHAANCSLKETKIPLNVVPGQRVLLQPTLHHSYNINDSLTVDDNRTYLLLQLPRTSFIAYIDQVMYELQLKKIIPIINEPECHPYFRNNPNAVYELVKKGAVMQISSQSLMGYNGAQEKRFAYLLLRHGLVHLMASGCHATNYQKYALPKAYDVIQRRFGVRSVYLLMENAESVMGGQGIQKEQPERIRKEKFLGIF
ncbi:CpsB/CapC family capsule biosynthesis tyrosine phosphatase [Bacillus sp. CBEL-1]|uniref:tyrosine-protein phosphatase n=1 Tax=Bacillus sp. CBEL-1 TaxID=2502980 RepID=UPI00104CDFEB|nr:CpsB/CapC family capsule biosynthesis tyrosine phosphatase [Bacillus sp. CBEL-1]TDB55441.1 tyrosine protein phosphatase [Bacillus sp. CBEL-1]